MKQKLIAYIGVLFMLLGIATIGNSFVMSDTEFKGITYYVDATETDQGAAGNGGGAYDIVTALGASKQITLVFDMTDTSNNNTDYVFSTSLTFTSNYTLDIRSGARLDPDSAKTVTVNSPEHLICGKRQQIKTGDGSLAFTNGGTVYPDWWGDNTTPGTTDMTTEIQAAIDSIIAGEVLYNGETYLISSPLVPESFVNLMGIGGTIIKLADNSDDDMVDFTGTDTDILIEGIEFDGNGTNQARGDGVNIIQGTTTVKRLTITKCKFTDSSFCSIALTNSNEDIIITENKFYDYDATAIQLTQVTGGVVSDNLFDNTGITLTAGANAISINFGADITVTGNRVNMSDTAVAACFALEVANAPTQTVFTGNTIKCNDGVFNGGISVGHGSGEFTATISGNSISDVGHIAAIEIGGSNITVSGNAISGTGSAVSSIALNGGNTGMVIIGNTISDYAGAGIDCQLSGAAPTDSYGIVISGNTFINSSAVAGGAHSIYFNGSPASGLVVSGNTIINNALSFGIHGITTSDTSRYLNGFSITDNSIHNCHTGIYFHGTDNTNHVITGNNITGCANESVFEGTNHIIKNNTPYTEILTGVVTLNRHMSAATIDSNGGAVTGTLGDGYFIGQIKTIVMTDASASSTVTVTHHDNVNGVPAIAAPTADGEVGTFDAADETWILIWMGTEWTTIRATCTFV